MQIYLDPPIGHEAKSVIAYSQDEVENLTRRGWLVRPDKPEVESNQRAQWEGREWVIYTLTPTSWDIYNNIIDTGYLVEPENFYLKLDEQSRALFTSMLTLIQELSSFGYIDDNTPQVISDKSEINREISTLRFRQIMIGYGIYYKNAWTTAALN